MSAQKPVGFLGGIVTCCSHLQSVLFECVVTSERLVTSPAFSMTKANAVHDILVQREFFTTWNGKLSYVDGQLRSVYGLHVWEPHSIIHEIHWACPELFSMHDKPQGEGPNAKSTTTRSKEEDRMKRSGGGNDRRTDGAFLGVGSVRKHLSAETKKKRGDAAYEAHDSPGQTTPPEASKVTKQFGEEMKVNLRCWTRYASAPRLQPWISVPTLLGIPDVSPEHPRSLTEASFSTSTAHRWSTQPRTSPLAFSNRRRHRFRPQNHRAPLQTAVFIVCVTDASLL